MLPTAQSPTATQSIATQSIDTQPPLTKSALSEAEVSRVIEMAWEDHTPFDAIEHLYGLSEPQVIVLMRQNMKPSSFRMWRKRVTGRASKHMARRSTDQARHHAAAQYKIRHGRK